LPLFGGKQGGWALLCACGVLLEDASDLQTMMGLTVTVTGRIWQQLHTGRLSDQTQSRASRCNRTSKMQGRAKSGMEKENP
jgi:hypothetical protein